MDLIRRGLSCILPVISSVSSRRVSSPCRLGGTTLPRCIFSPVISFLSRVTNNNGDVSGGSGREKKKEKTNKKKKSGEIRY